MNEMDDRLDVLINDSSSSDDNEEPEAKNIVDINAVSSGNTKYICNYTDIFMLITRRGL